MCKFARVVGVLVLVACHATEAGRVEPRRLETAEELATVPATVRRALDAMGDMHAQRTAAHESRRVAEIAARNASERAEFDRIRESGGLRVVSHREIQQLLDHDLEQLRSTRSDVYIGNWAKTREELARRLQPCTEPEIASTSVEPIEPEVEFRVEGCAFGEATGRVEFTLSNDDLMLLDPCGPGRTPPRPSYLTIEDWTDDLIEVRLPPIVGHVDKLVELRVERADGVRSEPFPVLFRATRDQKVLPPHYLHFAIEHPRSDDDSIESLPCRAPAGNPPQFGTREWNASFHVDHFHDCCYPQVTGHDTITGKLINGWDVISIEPKQIDAWNGRTNANVFGNQPGTAIVNYFLDATPGADGSVEFRIECDWWIDWVESGVTYYGQIRIEGPIGIRYGDPAEFEQWECNQGDPCSTH